MYFSFLRPPLASIRLFFNHSRGVQSERVVGGSARQDYCYDRQRACRAVPSRAQQSNPARARQGVARRNEAVGILGGTVLGSLCQLLTSQVIYSTYQKGTKAFFKKHHV